MFLFGLLLIVIAVAIGFSRKSAPTEAQRMALRGASIVIGVLAAAIIFASMVKIVQAGHVAVIRLFGKVNQTPLSEGMHLVNPFASLEQVSIRTEQYTMSGVSGEGAQTGDDAIRTLSKDGLPLPVDVTVTYRPIAGMVPWLYRSIGTSEDFVAKIIRPAFRAAVRDGVAMFTAQEAYSSKREQLAVNIGTILEKYITANLSKSEGYRGEAFIVQQVLMRNIELPERLKASIEAKLTAEQESLRMEFIIAKEKQEAERKRIEGRGIADFQAIVSQGLSDKLLQWKGIEATQELAKSTNAKVVVIGSGKGGLPIILNTDQAPSKP